MMTLLAFVALNALLPPVDAEPGAASNAPGAQSSGNPALGLTIERLLEPGPEAQRLTRQVGAWDVVMTVRPTADATPIVMRNLIAERTMVGLYLNEVMRPAAGANVPDFRRIDYLTYDPVQTRWEYASIDTRAPIGIMFARSVEVERGPDITVYFDNFANPGIGTVGGSVRARHVDKAETNDRHIKQQYWTVPGQPEWLAVQYEYTRRP
jgi:hypothetical protein